MAEIGIFVGTMYGNSLLVAEEAEAILTAQGHKATVFEDPELSDWLPYQDKYVLVVTSTTGQGDLPDSIVPLFQGIKDTLGFQPNLRYGVIALGDSSYVNFCNGGKQFPGTYVRPHRHPHTFELLLPLRGRFVVLNFDDRGTVTHRAILGETCTVLEMAAGTWHAVLSLDTGGIIFEVKHGGYQPVAADDYAHWAPAEGEPGTTELMAWYAQAQVGDSTFAV